MISQNTVTLPKMALAGHQKVAFAILTVVFLLYWRQPTLTQFALAGLLLVLPLFLYLTFRLIDGDAVLVMLLWLGLFPLSYYFRATRSISVELVLIPALAVGIALCPRSRTTQVPPGLRRCGWAWFAFLLAALVSLVGVGSGYVRPLLLMWLKAFLLPAVLGWYIVACFPVRAYLRLLHGVICGIAIYALAIGIVELYLGRGDLWSGAGALEYLTGTQGEGSLLRVAGPYGAVNSFGLIGLITVYLLGFLRNAMEQRPPRWQRVLHGLGVTAALLGATMTLFRSIFITIVLVFFLDLFRQMKRSQKALRIGGLAVICAAILAAGIYFPELYEERVSSAVNLYARIAQQRQNLQLFLDNPVLGVGLGNFYQAASVKPALSISYGGVAALDTPHSNIGGILAETGTFGFIPYALSQCLLLAAFWKLRTVARKSGKLVWTFFIYIFLSYWISGLALASAYYSELNFWFIFSLAVIYKYGVSAEAGQVAVPVE
jgi:hypothetical protein